jgi:hypothetical protein
MKIYKQLEIPSDSAWGRKTWRTYAPVWFLHIMDGINNLISWWSVIWYDRHWDDQYIFEILQRKIELQREYLVKANRHTRIPIDNRDMTIVLNLIERVRLEYYALEYFDYEESILRFEPTGEEMYSLEIDLISESYDAYLKKYRTSVRAVMKKDMKTAINKSTLCLRVAEYNHKKAHNLLFKILNERIAYWWD